MEFQNIDFFHVFLKIYSMFYSYSIIKVDFIVKSKNSRKIECACLKILLMFPWVDTDQLLVLYTICRPVAQLSRYLLDITQVGNEKTHEFFVVLKSKYETCVTNLSISYWCLDNLCLFL